VAIQDAWTGVRVGWWQPCYKTWTDDGPAIGASAVGSLWVAVIAATAPQ
jgi:hypothetical protein